MNATFSWKLSTGSPLSSAPVKFLTIRTGAGPSSGDVGGGRYRGRVLPRETLWEDVRQRQARPGRHGARRRPPGPNDAGGRSRIGVSEACGIIRTYVRGTRVVSELRSAIDALRCEQLAELPDARIEEDFAELQRA